jgi:hypothetical protein
MSTFKDIDHTDEFLKKLEELTTTSIQAGVFSDKSEGGLLMAVTSNEFGAKIPVSDGMRKLFAAKGFPLKKDTKFFIIPERAAIRKAFDSDKNIDDAIDMGVEIFNKNQNAKQMIKAMGAKMISFIQASIRSNIQPGNHPFTVLEKGGKNKTLVDTGRFAQGVTYKTA